MKVTRIADHPQNDVNLEGAKNVRMRMLIGPDENAPTFHMRHFEIQPGGNTPHHAHDFEHEVLILKGRGHVKSPAGDKPFEPGMVVWVPANEQHAFCNTGREPVEMICLIPAPKCCAL